MTPTGSRTRIFCSLAALLVLVATANVPATAFQQGTTNPFRKKPKSQPNSAPAVTEKSRPGSPEESGRRRPSRPPRRFRHGAYIELAPPENGWSYSVAQQTYPDVLPQHLPLSGLLESGRIKRFVATRDGAFGVLTVREHRGPTQIRVVDLQQGQLAASIQTGRELLVLDIDRGGDRVVLMSDRFGQQDKQQLATFGVRGETLEEESVFTPFPDLGFVKGDVETARFVGEHQLLALSRSGRVSVWNLETLKEDFGFDLSGTVKLAQGPDPDLIAFVDGEKYGLFDLQQRKLVGVAELPKDLPRPEIAVSPSGTRLALGKGKQVIVIDMANGELLQEISLTAGACRRLEFTTDEFLLVDSSHLYSISERMLLWTYSGAGSSVSVAGRTSLLIHDRFDAEPGLVTATLPHPEAQAVLNSLHEQPELYAVRPGVSVQIDVSGVLPRYQDDVRKALGAELRQRDLVVAQESDVVLVAGVTGPEEKVQEYGGFGLSGGGGYIITEYESTLEVRWRGQLAWSRRDTNAPGSVSVKEGQSLQEALREATREPDLRIFERAMFPQYLQKPNGKSGGSSSALGRSDVTSLADDR